MKKYLASLLTITVASFFLNFGNVSTIQNAQAKQEVCPDGDGWTKIESSTFYPVAGAVNYCFKAGPYVTFSTEFPEGGFGQPGGCSASNPQGCTLSHWSFLTPSCLNPTGTLKISYPEGWHQIVGGSLLWGSDIVYSLDSIDFLQCYCGEDGQGIQTYWWRTELESLLGWFSENGVQWDLGEFHYLALNTPYSCQE